MGNLEISRLSRLCSYHLIGRYCETESQFTRDQSLKFLVKSRDAFSAFVTSAALAIVFIYPSSRE